LPRPKKKKKDEEKENKASQPVTNGNVPHGPYLNPCSSWLIHPSVSCPFSFIKLFPSLGPLYMSGKTVTGFEIEETWMDILAS
jgi:hypothetical protein